MNFCSGYSNAQSCWNVILANDNKMLLEDKYWDIAAYHLDDLKNTTFQKKKKKNPHTHTPHTPTHFLFEKVGMI